MQNDDYKYKLYIPFTLKTYVQINLTDRLNFKIDEMHGILGKIEENNYYLCIFPINTEKEAENLFKKVEIILKIISLKYNLSIEYDKTIKKARIFEKTVEVNENLKINGDFNLNETTIIPLIDKIVYMKMGSLNIKTYVTAEEFINSLNNSFKYDLDKIKQDKKLNSSLEIYSQYKKYSKETQFINLITILDILKERYEVNEELQEFINKLISSIRDEKKKYGKNSEEYRELSRHENKVRELKYKSITKSLHESINNYNNFESIKNIDKKLNNSFKIRNTLVHQGKIKDEEEFFEHLKFLEDFIKRLLENKIEEYKL